MPLAGLPQFAASKKEVHEVVRCELQGLRRVVEGLVEVARVDTALDVIHVGHQDTFLAALAVESKTRLAQACLQPSRHIPNVPSRPARRVWLLQQTINGLASSK